MNSATADFIDHNRNADVRKLALQKPPADVDMLFALQQIEGWQLARRKLPTWAATPGIIYPPRLALEQCSSEATAAYKASLIANRLLQPQPDSTPISSIPPANTPSPHPPTESLESAIQPIPAPPIPPILITAAPPAHNPTNPSSSPHCVVYAAVSQRPTLCDLTGGLAVDFLTLAPFFAEATYIDRQPALVEAARHNSLSLLPAAATRLNFLCADAVAHLQAMSPTDLIFLDPARRDAAGRKVALIKDCQPDVCALQDLLLAKSRICLVKLSPMLDITAALRALPSTTEVHVISLDGECKEILLMMQPNASALSPTITCAILRSAPSQDGSAPEPFLFTFTPSEEALATPICVEGFDDYLYEPDPALLKAGAYKLISYRFGLPKLAPDTHLYTSSRLVSNFPGRAWRIIGHSTFSKRDLRTFLAGIRSAEITVRGFPTSVAALRRRLALPDGPDAHLVATTLYDGSHILFRVEPV